MHSKQSRSTLCTSCGSRCAIHLVFNCSEPTWYRVLLAPVLWTNALFLSSY